MVSFPDPTAYIGSKEIGRFRNPWQNVDRANQIASSIAQLIIWHVRLTQTSLRNASGNYGVIMAS